MKFKLHPAQIIPPVLGIITALLFNYWCMPAHTLRSPGLWFLILGSVAVALIAEAIIDYIVDESWVGTAVYGIVTALILVAMIVCNCFGSKMFNADQYQKLIEVTNGSFSEDIPTVEDTSKIAVVDLATAEKLGDRTVGGIKNATWYEVDDEYNLIIKNGQQYRISPLNYGGLFKYNKSKYFGIPAYVLVNTQTQKAEYVELDEAMKVSPSACFGQKLERVLRKQYPTLQFGTSYFEVDEQGNPYWITSVQTPSMGVWKAKLVTAVVITDAVTGESEMYEVDEVPKWVDHVYPLDYLMTLVNYNFKYVNGYWNFSQTGVNRTTYSYRTSGSSDTPAFAGYNSAITSDGQVVFFTGVTPANGAETNLGFILASPSTGVVKYYDCAGAEESSAQAAAEGLVQNLSYKATFPTILNVDGVETYFMALKDGAGLVQRYALCQVANYVNVVEATTLDEALIKYKQKLGMVEEETAPVVESSTV